MKKFKKISSGGGVFAATIIYGGRKVASINSNSNFEAVKEWFDLIMAAKMLYEVVSETLPEDCSTKKDCLHCKAMRALAIAEGRS